MLYAPIRVDSLPRSALPHAPVIPSLDARRSPGPARRSVAAMMRATADRLSPATA
jgi:hypothetical protein